MTAELLGGPLDEPVGFANQVTSFIDENGIRLNGHGLWPFLPTATSDASDPFWISYDSSTLRERSDFLHVGVAGVKYRAQPTRLTTAGGPGERLQILPEPTNPVNSAALAIHTADLSHQIGYIYDDDLSDVRTALGRGWLPLSVWEWRYDNGERCAMHALVLQPQLIGELIATARSARSNRRSEYLRP